jgi:hypothetical protein
MLGLLWLQITFCPTAADTPKATEIDIALFSKEMVASRFPVTAVHVVVVVILLCLTSSCVNAKSSKPVPVS